jgi:7-cyano-7-deazaguanine reductase
VEPKPLRRATAFHYNTVMSLRKTTRLGYSPDHAKAGLDHQFPAIDTFANQFPGYEVEIDIPEFTSVCPKTGLPDFATIWIRYMPSKLCFEMKSLKLYINEYRNLGIFQENVVNKILEDVVAATKPVWAEVRGEFKARGGLGTKVIARWPRPKK